MDTPARMWRSWIAVWASFATRASATRSLIPSTMPLVADRMRGDRLAVGAQQVEHLRQVQLALRILGGQPRQRGRSGAP